MRMSCNGCRVLRKGCSDDCTLRPCLDWIKCPKSQANATLFLAKFYGRAGLLNLINAGPDQHQPALFRSLLYEACGRVVNPVYGAVGLMWSNNWDKCQSAVDAVLSGSPIMQFSLDESDAAMHPIMPLKGSDIRHVSNAPGRAQKNIRAKRRVKTQPGPFTEYDNEPARFSISGWAGNHPEEMNRAWSDHDSSMFSVETIEASEVNRVDLNPVMKFEPECGEDHSRVVVGLELSLGFNPMVHAHAPMMEMRGL